MRVYNDWCTKGILPNSDIFSSTQKYTYELSGLHYVKKNSNLHCFSLPPAPTNIKSTWWFTDSEPCRQGGNWLR